MYVHHWEVGKADYNPVFPWRMNWRRYRISDGATLKGSRHVECHYGIGASCRSWPTNGREATRTGCEAGRRASHRGRALEDLREFARATRERRPTKPSPRRY